MSRDAEAAFLAAARPFILDTVARKLPLFAAYRDVTRDDLIAVGSVGLLRAWRKGQRHDPSRAQFSTFVEMIVTRRLLDYARSRSRDRDRTERVRETKPGYVEVTNGHQTEGDDDLAEWLGRVYRAAAHYVDRYAPPRPGRPNTYHPAARVALLALKRRMNLSSRGMTLMLRARPEMLRAVRIDVAPHDCYFRRIEKSGAQFNFRP